PFSPSTFRRYVRAAWLCEGAATFLAGQVPHLRGAIVRRLREGGKPSFPPAARDAYVLGGTVFALLESERGPKACAELAGADTDRSGRVLVEQAFGRPAATVERAWFGYLDSLGAG
ncbi:MAG TPA: hypothetical protein VFD31_04105, partial [Thermoleophilaceae bacterium]|nr:hypothetical protein [Thermoleophilaceae bacterium]